MNQENSQKVLYPATHEEAVELKKQYARQAKSTKIDKMHIAYGTTKGKRCGECQFLRLHQHARNYFKCAKYGETSGPGTDWRVRWEACGLFEPSDMAKELD